MLFSYNWIQSFLDGKAPKAEELAKNLTLHSFEVEDIKKAGQDTVFDVDITPNRAGDCFSHIGVARECAVVSNLKFRQEKFKLKEDAKLLTKKFIQVNIEKAKDCPRYVGRIIQGVKVGPSPKIIQNRLKSCGLQPINNIVDATNYVMLETGQPLHAFDYDKIDGREISIRRARDKEEITTLSDQNYKLDKDVLVISDRKGPLAIAGIKGGQKAAIDSETKNLFLEAGNFFPDLIHKTSRKLNLRTDASLRFEHGLDVNIASQAIDKLAFLIQESAGGKIAKGKIDIYPQKIIDWKIKLNLIYLNKLLGIKIAKQEVIKILESLWLTPKEFEKDKIEVTIPTWRIDLRLPEDLIEEIGRIYGYDKIKPNSPLLSFNVREENREVLWQRKIKNILKESGFNEVYNYSFISKQIGDSLGSNLVELENPSSQEFFYLRPNLLINLCKDIKINTGIFSQNNSFKFFEIGKVFKEKNGFPIEKKILSAVITTQKNNGFFQLKGIVDTLLKQLGISDIFYDDWEASPSDSQNIFWDSQASAEIKIGGQEIGFLGKIFSGVLADMGLKSKKQVFAFEIDFKKLLEFCNEEIEYQKIYKYPSAIRDVAVLVPYAVKVVDILNTINIAGGNLVRDVDLFDFYEGDNLPEHKKSIAFHIIFQAEDRTLTSEEIDRAYKKIIKALEDNLDWELR